MSTCGGHSLDKLKNALNQISIWGKSRYGEIPSQIKTHQETLEKLKAEVPNIECLQKIKEIEKNLEDLLKKEEVWWEQRAKVHWHQQGDLNTKFFHHRANQRKRRNHFQSIQDTLGNTGRTILIFIPLL